MSRKFTSSAWPSASRGNIVCGTRRDCRRWSKGSATTSRVAEGGGDLLAPNAERKDGGGGAVRRELPFLAIALGFLVLALIVVIILWLVIGSNADSTVQAIKKLLGGGK